MCDRSPNLAGNLQSNVVTRYNFITPNLCDDMSGNAGCLTGESLITAGDTWLSNNIPIIMSLPGVQQQRRDLHHLGSRARVATARLV